jgi:hypothetical protein
LSLPSLEEGLDQMTSLVAPTALAGSLERQEEEEQPHEKVEPRARKRGAPSRTERRLQARTKEE